MADFFLHWDFWRLDGDWEHYGFLLSSKEIIIHLWIPAQIGNADLL